MQTIEFIRNGGEVKRYHTWPMLSEQNVAAHSFGVAMLYALMAQDGWEEDGVIKGGLTVPGLMAALCHDLAEQVMGDIPSPAKRALETKVPEFINGFKTLEAERLAEHGLNWEETLVSHEKRWLKIADCMEGALHCVRERMMGNKFINVVFMNYRSYLAEMKAGEIGNSAEVELVKFIDDMWEKANG